MHLDGQTVRPGATFHFDVHVFDLRDPAIPYLVLAFAEMAHTGLGPGRSRAKLTGVYQIDLEGRTLGRLCDGATMNGGMDPQPSTIPLEPRTSCLERIRVEFVTPTELKHANALVSRPDFGILFARPRPDRHSERAVRLGAAIATARRGRGEFMQ